MVQSNYLFLLNYNVFSSALMVSFITLDCTLPSLMSMIVGS